MAPVIYRTEIVVLGLEDTQDMDWDDIGEIVARKGFILGIDCQPVEVERDSLWPEIADHLGIGREDAA